MFYQKISKARLEELNFGPFVFLNLKNTTQMYTQKAENGTHMYTKIDENHTHMYTKICENHTHISGTCVPTLYMGEPPPGWNQLHLILISDQKQN
jgi:hypothetical protein